MSLRRKIKFVVFGISMMCLAFAGAQEALEGGDASMGTIHKIDLMNDKPTEGSYRIIQFDTKRTKVAGSRGHSIIRQFAKRVRVEFEGAGIPKGSYSLAAIESCPSVLSVAASRYQTAWKELHRFKVTTTHIATEKSQPKVSLNDAGEGLYVLKGKSLALFRIGKDRHDLIDCKSI